MEAESMIHLDTPLKSADAHIVSQYLSRFMKLSEVIFDPGISRMFTDLISDGGNAIASVRWFPLRLRNRLTVDLENVLHVSRS